MISCGALAAGCGDSASIVSGPDTGVDAASDIVVNDVASDKVAADAALPDAPDVADAPVDAAPSDVAGDASDAGDAGDAGVDAPADVAMDVVVDTGPFDAGPPPDVGPVDVSPVDTGPTVIRGHTARSLVSAGSLMTSPSYRLVSTLGQSSINQSVLRSTNYRLRGGLVGASGGTR